MRALRWWSLRQRLARIQLLVLDVDGVLTDGGLWFDASGQLIKRFDVRDGLGIRLLQQAGLQLAFLSGGQGGATQVRAQQLGIAHCLVGIKDKPAALTTLQNQLGVSPERTARSLRSSPTKAVCSGLTPSWFCRAVRAAGLSLMPTRQWAMPSCWARTCVAPP